MLLWRQKVRFTPESDIKCDITECPLWAEADISPSFDNVGDLLEVRWHSQAQRFCGLEINDQLEFRRSLDRQVSRLFAFENPAGVSTSEAICIRLAWPITCQSTDVCKLAHKMDCRNRKTCRQPDELIAATHEERIGSNDDGVNMLLDGTLEGRVGFAFTAGL